MNELDRGICKDLRAMKSHKAALWLIEKYPSNGCRFVICRSWGKDEQYSLAAHYLANIPHASGMCYKNLISIMSIRKFISIIMLKAPFAEENKDLLRYYVLQEANRASKTDSDEEAIRALKIALQPEII